MAFHWKDEWYFERWDNGGVRIYHQDLEADQEDEMVEYDVCLDIDVDSWCSIMASVSAQGDTAEAFQEARTFHHKGKTVA